MSGNYNEARERHEASYYEAFSDHDELDQLDFIDEDNPPIPDPDDQEES